MTFTLADSLPYITGYFQGNQSWFVVEHISIDSRSFQNGSGTLFFAIKGHSKDGHTFIPELIEQGVRYFVVEYIPENCSSEANFIVVPHTVTALQEFAAYYRSLFSIPVIGITGSNGKTIVKEWLNFLLSPEYNICKNPKSYNSQIGVPLSVVAVNEYHTLGIFEAGISTRNEMEQLQKVIQPTLGILTNIGSAHNQGFESEIEKITEKLKLFTSAQILIYPYHSPIASYVPTHIQSFTWALKTLDSSEFAATVNITYQTQGLQTELHIDYNAQHFLVQVPFTDNASLENCCTCITTLLYLKYTPEQIQQRLPLLYPIEMRLKVKKGIQNTILIDDSYSSDFQSFKIALDFLETQKQHSRKTLIISDIFQSGFSEEDLYKKVFQYIIKNNIQRVILIGHTITQYLNLFPQASVYSSTQQFLNDISKFEFANETILIKGARAFHFEDIVSALEEKVHETVFEINLNAITHNLTYFKSKLAPQTKMMAMVKAFGYGNGGIELAKLLEYHNIDYLGVAFADEGIFLKTNGIRTPIMVLNPEISSYSNIIAYGLEPEIYSFRGLEAFTKVLNEKNITQYPIHIKIDTGMHRLGFLSSDIPKLIPLVAQKNVKVVSILSHLAASDDPKAYEFTNQQIQLFLEISKQITEALPYKPLLHILNTSGISNYTHAQLDMVRLGIGLYGISNDDKEQNYLENVGTLKSVISQIRTIKAEESVGYNRRFIAQRTSHIATIPIGYADGIRRNWGNNVGHVLINGSKAPIIGSICMDMLMVDVTDIVCYEGDSVIIFGELLSVNEIAQKTNTIPYEILTGISHRVKRVFYRE